MTSSSDADGPRQAGDGSSPQAGHACNQARPPAGSPGPPVRHPPRTSDQDAAARRARVMARAARAVAVARALVPDRRGNPPTEQEQIDEEVHTSELAYHRWHDQALIDAELLHPPANLDPPASPPSPRPSAARPGGANYL